MSEMKMSDHFELPLYCVLVDNADVGCAIELEYDKSVTDEQAQAVDYAINNHDRMMEEIAELQAALELMVLHFESNHNSEHECKVIKLSKKILPNLNQEGEE